MYEHYKKPELTTTVEKIIDGLAEGNTPKQVAFDLNIPLGHVYVAKAAYPLLILMKKK